MRQEAPALPKVLSEDDTAVLDLLSNERDQALSEATRIRNQIHALLVHLDPDYDRRLKPVINGLVRKNQGIRLCMGSISELGVVVMIVNVRSFSPAAGRHDS